MSPAWKSRRANRQPIRKEAAAFARTEAQGEGAFVVLDTAPTGHTLLLLDATESYQREVARNPSNMPEEVVQLLPRLRDASFTRVVVVTLPEATPVHEAAALQDDLRRAQIEPFAWVINQSFVESGSHDPLLMACGANELAAVRIPVRLALVVSDRVAAGEAVARAIQREWTPISVNSQ